MPCADPERVITSFSIVVGECDGLPDGEQERKLNDWVGGVGPDCLEVAIRLQGLFYKLGKIKIPSGSTVIFVNKSTNVNTGGGAIVGANVGSDNAKVTAQIIQAMSGNISQSGNMDQRGAEVFKDAFDALPALEASEEEKQALAEQLDKLKQEVQKAESKPGILKMCWNAIWSVGKSLGPIVALGKWLHDKFPRVIDVIK
jgi:hypothetical protein